ncbi:MAG: SRPBCC family protein [Thermomicrobiales bacterium]|nr:SRPBCC family protein [Thermomicrobiales bacterium]
MRFEHQFEIDAPSERVWSFLMDVPQMAACIPGASGVTQVNETTYDATVTAKIGPISAKFGCRIAILDLDESTRKGSVEVAGKDTKLGGGVKAKMEMSLAGGETGPTTVSIVSEVDIMGKIGQYGHGMIAKRADAMLADFAACTRAKLATSS